MIIEELARNIVNTDFDAFDTDTLAGAKNRLIDIIGCTIGGINAPGCSMMGKLVTDWGGKEQATMLGYGGKVPAGNAAMVNSVMARSFDFGVLIPFIGEQPVWSHIEESTVPAALAVAEWKRAGGKELLTALILGDDITTRISAASSYTPAVSWDGPGIQNKFGTTAIACKLMGMDERQIINALGLVLNQLAGSFQGINDGALSFKFAQGLSARDGIIAAELAKLGWNAGKDPLMGKYGYFSIYCEKGDLNFLTNNLGKKFYGDSTFKPYPCCRFTHCAIDCALQIVNENDVKIEDIETITLDIAPMHVGGPLDQPFEIKEFPHVHALMSYRYQVANVLLRKSAKLEYLTDEQVRDPKVGALAGKIKVTGAIPPEKLESANLTVKMRDGRELKAYTDVAKGHPLKKPLSKQEIEDKFRTNVAFSKTISGAKAEETLRMLNHIEEIDDVTDVVRLLTI
jgi:2-methylcitrate dehydratase PrpD